MIDRAEWNQKYEKVRDAGVMPIAAEAAVRALYGEKPAIPVPDNLLIRNGPVSTPVTAQVSETVGRVTLTRPAALIAVDFGYVKPLAEWLLSVDAWRTKERR